MKPFMDEDFLLTTDTAKTLFHTFAEPLPIIDYHCHISPKEIAEDICFENITQIWLRGDHYKWRQMRSNGVEEKYITGDAADWEKFQKWAETLEMAIGNPLYHWSHLELKRYFNYNGVLNGQTAKEVWNLCNKKLIDEKISARELIRKSNVEVICTTDDPIDELKWHKLLKNTSFQTKVLPAWRPDRVLAIQKEDYLDYLEKLEHVSGKQITSYKDLEEALTNRMNYFEEHGCVLSDHGLEYIMYNPADLEIIEQIFLKRKRNEELNQTEILQFKTALLLFLGRGYAKRNWVMQLHYGVKRDNNKRSFEKLGGDTGFDSISSAAPVNEMADLLNALDYTNELPKTILYSLNPIDNAAIGTIIGCFQNAQAIGKIQHGSAWWFNDNKTGMTEQIISLANLGLLGNFIGMLTDSRSFLSYTRHEYFRRIFCELIGNWVENGEYPNDTCALKKIVEGVSYYNGKRYFGFK